MSLNSPEITELTTEDAPLNLLAEWLRSYFDGGLHAVGANDPVVFPAVNLAFNQSSPLQPMFQWANGAADTEIRVVMLPRNEERDHCDTVLSAGYLVTSRVLLQFQVRSKQATSEKAQQSVQTVAKLLKAILSNPDCIADLGAKGFRLLAPELGKPMQSTDYALRLVFCNAQMLYPIRFGPQPDLPAGAVVPDFLLGSLPVAFNQPNALIVGEYLLNQYLWTKAVKLTSAVALAFAPQTAPVVLELEVNGTLTGQQLTIPIGAENVENSSGNVTFNVFVPAGQVVRWKVISAPDPVDSGWRCSVTTQVLPA